ncbi:SGNH/GDSL hydrolase family protein [Nocardiopsis sp. FIRDI 009]|uniref:SGNH/GDSL hydrolase family protein n=1 Tax=Nocardiopsis sp. FIRDI 009 TaxID=714197 RepID=UPI000E23162D|nr:SGNH/GDSL hydrolase family protein [Nocardiopsis sp. FIRDI 009]
MPRTDDSTIVPAARPRRTPLLAVPIAAALCLASAPAAAEAQEAVAYDSYVALGDSFTSGPLIPPYAPGSDPRCLRSSGNYARLAADALGVAEFTDVSCAGAVIRDLREPQHTDLTDVPPQFDALTPDTDLVTVGISGNDLGFTDILMECARRSLTNPIGSPCADHYGDELDQRIEDLRDDVSGVYAEIAERSPGATVVSVGYLQILPERRGCWPEAPIAWGDVAYLDGVQTALNRMIAEESQAAGAVFVDVLERGHDVCQSSSRRWVEGLVPENTAAPVHPNEAGMVAVSERLVARLGA